MNYFTTNIHLNVILFFFFLFPKIYIASYASNFACWFWSCEDLRIISIKIFENAICNMPVGKHCVSTNYSVRKKLHARLHGINLDAIDVLLVTIPEDIPFPRMGPRVWRRSISYLCHVEKKIKTNYERKILKSKIDDRCVVGWFSWYWFTLKKKMLVNSIEDKWRKKYIQREIRNRRKQCLNNHRNWVRSYVLSRCNDPIQGHRIYWVTRAKVDSITYTHVKRCFLNNLRRFGLFHRPTITS